jgi:hypothetical protein
MPWLEFAGDNKKLCCFLVLLLYVVNVVHSFLINTPPRPKSASHLRRPLPNPAGNLVPARIGGKCPELGIASLSAPRPPPLGVPLIPSLGILAAGLQRVLAGFGFTSGEYERSWQMQERSVHKACINQGSRAFCGTAG